MKPLARELLRAGGQILGEALVRLFARRSRAPASRGGQDATKVLDDHQWKSPEAKERAHAALRHDEDQHDR